MESGVGAARVLLPCSFTARARTGQVRRHQQAGKLWLNLGRIAVVA